MRISMAKSSKISFCQSNALGACYSGLVSIFIALFRDTAIWVFVIFCMTVGVELFTTYQCYASGNPHWYFCRAHFAHLTASIEGVCLGLVFLNKDNDFGKTKTRMINGAAVAIPIVTVAYLVFFILFPETLGVLLMVGGVFVLYTVTCFCICWCLA